MVYHLKNVHFIKEVVLIQYVYNMTLSSTFDFIFLKEI
jgi:hypothetical protein